MGQRTEIIRNFESNLKDLSNNLQDYLKITLGIGKEFGGPSVYFHKMALIESKRNFLEKSHLDMIYAVMPSWGMHRTGTKAIMVDHFSFLKNIQDNKGEIIQLKEENIKNAINKVNDIVELIKKITVSKSNSQLVASTKVLHHILPNIISPIDREYSITFLKGNKIMTNNNEEEYANIFLKGMFDFLNTHEEKIREYVIEPDEDNINDNNFNTSCTKIFDNLIMAYVKKHKGKIVDK
jgi:hypothetical protein